MRHHDHVLHDLADDVPWDGHRDPFQHDGHDFAHEHGCDVSGPCLEKQKGYLICALVKKD